MRKYGLILRTVCCHTEQISTLAMRILESESRKQALPQLFQIVW